MTRTQAFPMPDYDLNLGQGKDGPVLLMKRRGKPGEPDAPLPAALEG